MSTTSCEVRLMLTALEVLSAAEAPAAGSDDGRTLRYTGFNGSQSLSSTSTPKIEKPPAAQSITLGGGITTLDFTALALARDAGEAHDFTGKKLIGAILKANASNAAAISVAPGASNPYPLFGAGNDIDVGPGLDLAFCFLAVGSNLPAVSATVKTLDLSGTSGDKIDVFFLFGT